MDKHQVLKKRKPHYHQLHMRSNHASKVVAEHMWRFMSPQTPGGMYSVQWLIERIEDLGFNSRRAYDVMPVLHFLGIINHDRNSTYIWNGREIHVRDTFPANPAFQTFLKDLLLVMPVGMTYSFKSLQKMYNAQLKTPRMHKKFYDYTNIMVGIGMFKMTFPRGSFKDRLLTRVF